MSQKVFTILTDSAADMPAEYYTKNGVVCLNLGFTLNGESYLGVDGKFIEAYYKCSPLNLAIENSIKVLAYPPKITMDMYYNNDFYIEYTKDYNSLTTKIRHISSKTLKNVLYFDEGFWDINSFPHEKINVIKKLPATFFKSLEMTFFTKNQGQNFCINNIEFGKIKTKI